MSIARIIRCFLAGAIFTLVSGGSVLAQDADGELVRFLFTPPLGEDVVQAIETSTYLRVEENETRIRWSHEVVLRMDEQLPPDMLKGTFQLRNVVNQENADRDLYYLIAKAIEGQTYPLEMLDLGIAYETDWPGIQARVTERLPALADAATVAAIRGALPLFADGTAAVLRPTNTIGLAHILGFPRSGALHTRDDIGKLTYFGIEDAVVEISGGRMEGDDLGINWGVVPDPQAAAVRLSAELRALTQTMDQQLGTDSSRIIESAIAEGVEAGEMGHAIYDLEPGLMRQTTFDAWITTETVERFVRFEMTRLSP